MESRELEKGDLAVLLWVLFDLICLYDKLVEVLSFVPNVVIVHRSVFNWQHLFERPLIVSYSFSWYNPYRFIHNFGFHYFVQFLKHFLCGPVSRTRDLSLQENI